MSSPERAGAAGPSLAQEWFYALRYWLRGRNGVIAMVVLAVVIGAALNWSWLVALGIAPLLITVLPCAAMCSLGLCMNRIGGGSCSTEASSAETPKPDDRVPASLEANEQLLFDSSTSTDQPDAGPAVSPAEPPKPKEKQLT